VPNKHCAFVRAEGCSHHEALDVLEELVVRPPVIGPAEVVRDPLYFKPLAGNARYERFAERLESEITENLKAMAPLLEGGSVPKPRAL
jgi:hypothetical protein